MQLMIKTTVLIFSIMAFMGAQTQVKNERARIVRQFISAGLHENGNAKFIMDSLMYFAPLDTAVSMDKRLQILEGHLENFKVRKGIDSVADYTYIPYGEYHQSKVDFATDPNNLGILLNKGQPLTYLLFEGSKIRAFDYITKGTVEPGYFIVY
ncbi:hypothetical protein [Parapedobacter koreensis]|uniref:Uncharacterized protein n=1 Tax=Parapedobacter koreensis TaxID=332977 RepID=A0A1H7TTV9_9SPHI|nr:hypothetical protein [Parapedobacter koreensis]SEL87985.1 hypothetical protein SAMN05421740_11274 [Parapedobacter koreensis]